MYRPLRRIARGSLLATTLVIAGAVDVPAARETGPVHDGRSTGPAVAASVGVPPVDDQPAALYFPILYSQLSVKPRVVAHLGGLSTAVAVRDRFAFLGQGAQLVVLDVAEPARPTPVASLHLGSEVHQVLVAADRAYVMTDQVHVVDIAVPTQPREVTRFGRYGYLAVDNGQLYVAEAGYAAYGQDAPALIAYDLADPNGPREVSRLPHPITCSMAGFYVYDLAISDHIAYMLSSNGIYRVDVRNAAAPQPIVCDFDHRGRFAPAGRSGYGFVFEGRRLTVVDVRERETVKDLAEVEVCPGEADRIAVAVGSSHYAYAVCEATTATTVHVYDVEQPAKPREVGALALPLAGERTLSYLDLVVRAGRVYLANAGTNLAILDFSRPAAPRLLGTYDTVKRVPAVAAAGGVLYVLDGDAFPGHLRVLRADPGQSPVEIGQVPLPGVGVALASAGDRVVIVGVQMPHAGWWAQAKGFVSVIDVSRPQQPTEIGRLDVPEGPADVDVLGNVAFVVSGWSSGYAFDGGSRLRVIDLTDPTHPRSVFTERRGQDLRDVVAAGTHLFVADRSSSPEPALFVLDVSIPSQTREVARLALPDAGRLALQGQWLALIGDYGTFHVVDVRDPTRPRVLSQMRLSYLQTDYNPAVTTWGDQLFLDWGRLRVFDMSQPARPAQVGDLGTAAAGVALAADADRLYVAEDLRGLTLVDWRGDRSP